MTTLEVKRALKAGKYAWPGGYPQYFVTRHGDVLSFEALTERFREEAREIEGVDINWEDAELYCDHTGARIPSAYAEPED